MCFPTVGGRGLVQNEIPIICIKFYEGFPKACMQLVCI